MYLLDLLHPLGLQLTDKEYGSGSTGMRTVRSIAAAVQRPEREPRQRTSHVVGT